jgi:hypothetical protein
MLDKRWSERLQQCHHRLLEISSAFVRQYVPRPYFCHHRWCERLKIGLCMHSRVTAGRPIKGPVGQDAMQLIGLREMVPIEILNKMDARPITESQQGNSKTKPYSDLAVRLTLSIKDLASLPRKPSGPGPPLWKPSARWDSL